MRGPLTKSGLQVTDMTLMITTSFELNLVSFRNASKHIMHELRFECLNVQAVTQSNDDTLQMIYRASSHAGLSLHD